MSDTVHAVHDVYVRKDASGHITTISRKPVVPGEPDEPDWEALPGDAPEVLHFIEELTGAGSALRDSDLSFVRVLEDVIDLLVERAVIRFTDLPSPAQTKLLQRRNRRQQQGLQLLLDDDLLMLDFPAEGRVAAPNGIQATTQGTAQAKKE